MTGRLVTVNIAGRQTWGVVAGAGFVDLGPGFPQWPTLRDVIASQAIPQVLDAARARGDAS